MQKSRNLDFTDSEISLQSAIIASLAMDNFNIKFILIDVYLNLQLNRRGL